MESTLQLHRRHAMAMLIGLAAAPYNALCAEALNPPLWMVRRGKAKVYLFGEMFAGRDLGKSQKILAAFNESAAYWRETPPLNKDFLEKLTAEGQTEIPLADRIGAADMQRLLRATAAINVSPETLRHSRGWLIVQRLQGPLYQSLGVTMQQDAGVSQAAKAANKQTRYEFADGPELLGYFAGMPPETDRQYLVSTLANFETGREAWAQRAEAWGVGDLSVETAHNRQMARDFPAAWTYLTTVRNKAWVPRIQMMLQEGATCFVRVGLDHLIGPESIQRQLERSGLRVERVS